MTARLGTTIPDRLSDYELGELLRLRECRTLPEIARQLGYPVHTLRAALESIGIPL